MLTITCLAAFPTASVINFVLQSMQSAALNKSQLFALPLLLRTLVAVVTLLTLMTYVIMPRMTKLFAAWLYPNQSV